MQQLIMKRIAELQEELNKLKNEAAKQPSWDKLKSLEDGTVIVFDKKFGGLGTKAYTYAAMKKNDLWYLTSTGGQSHESLAEFLGTRTPYVIRMTANETLVWGGKTLNEIREYE